MKRFFDGAIWTLMVATSGFTASAKDDTLVVPPLSFSLPLPVVREIAGREHVPFEGIMPTSDRDGFQPGDSVTALVSLTKGEGLSQWLVQLTCVALNEKEQKRPPPAVHHLYTSAGTDLSFGGQYAAIDLRVLGPYTKTEKRKDAMDLKAHAIVNADNLALGFDRACEAILTLKHAGEKLKNTREGSPDKHGAFSWTAGEKPYPAEPAKEIRAMADLIGLNVERERALLGSIPALNEFWRLASRTPGLQDIIKEVADVPWFSIVMKGGDVNAGIGLDMSKVSSASLNGRAGGDRAGFSLPVSLNINGKAALSCNFLVTSPRPPLITCAGIVGLAAQAPNGKGPYLMIEIFDARTAENTVTATKPTDSPTALPADQKGAALESVKLH